MSLSRRTVLRDLARLFVRPPIDKHHQIARIDFMEENVFLPVKAFVVILLFNFIYYSGTFTQPTRPSELTAEAREIAPQLSAAGAKTSELMRASANDIDVQMVKRVFWAYVGINLLSALMLIFMHRFNIALIQWVVIVTNLIDAAFLTAWTIETGLLTESLYWIFLGLIVRNAVSVPLPTLQIGVNLAVIGCFAYAGIVDRVMVSFGLQRLDTEAVPIEAFSVRIFLMLLLMACCYGVQALFDNQRQTRENISDLSARQKQLETAGRMAAEIAHQIKNPLSIMTNSLYSLKRCLPDGKEARERAERHFEILQEELHHSDQIVTELMGYAQLAEGKVENLDFSEELENAIDQVFPDGSAYEVSIRRDIDEELPLLKMQRGHLRDILINLLKNSREAMDGRGSIHLTARPNDDYTILFTLEDTGPGIPPDKVERVFEPYFSTRAGGSGLGLAIVKHNTEIYGGSVKAESALGIGARFVLELPSKTLLRIES